jgi:hypothetical protein
MSKLFNLTKKDDSASELPVDWKESLRQSDYFIARRWIQKILGDDNKEAKSAGGRYIWKKEIGDAWKQFYLNPSYETAVRFVELYPSMFHCFDITSQQTLFAPIWTAKTFSLEGKYRLINNTSGIGELTELSQEEYEDIPRQVKGEIIYNAPPINFMGRQWEFVVSSIHGKICKWAAGCEVEKDENIESIGNDVIDYCVQWLGATTEEKIGHLYWDTEDGDVNLLLRNMTDFFYISIVVTSREFRSFERL